MPPPQPPSSGRRQKQQQFFAPTARSSTSDFQHLAANPPWQLAHSGYAGRTSWPLPAAVSAPWAKSRRHVKSWFGATPWRRVTKRTVMPGSNVSSIRRIGHRHGCMPLAKWETGSGRFGGCLIKTRSPNSADRGQAFKRLAHYLMICIKSDLVPRVWRACHYSAISLIRPFFCALLTYSSLTNY